ncbi:hypothetical protein WJX82_006006 [Trebouxia sp. C0006]
MTVSWFRISVLSGSIVARTQQARQELMKAMAIVLIQCPDMMSHSANTDKRWEWTGVTAPLTSNQSTYT